MPNFWDPLNERQRLIGGLIAAGVVAGLAYAGMNSPKRADPPPIVAVSAPVPAVAEKPVVGEKIVVHVAGAVKVPGLLHLPPDTRLGEAIKQAGGALSDADLDSVNLAAKLTDGTQVFVRRKAKRVAAEPPPPPMPRAYRGGIENAEYAPAAVTLEAKPLKGAPLEDGIRAKKAPASVVSLNSATSEELQTVPGIGPATADRILAYRQEHGPFQSIDDLTNVKGIGPKKLEKMKPWLKP